MMQVGAIGYTRMRDKNLTKAAISYFAMLIHADSKILPVETETVLKLLDNLDHTASEIMTEIFRQLLAEGVSGGNKPDIFHEISNYRDEDKLHILDCLWRIAICDNELHHAEEKLIYEYIDAVNIDRRTAIDIQASQNT